MKVLVVVAHPDDEVLGMGGTILKHSQNGDSVKIVYLATGIMSRRRASHQNLSKYDMNKEEQTRMKSEVETLQADARRACQSLKVKSNTFYDFPDNEMDSIPLLRIIKVVESEIKKAKPDRIYTNYYGDLNVDHRIVFNACLTACRPLYTKTPELVSFEVPSSTEWNYPSTFNPNLFVNIKKYLKGKIRAMQYYKNELRKFPHPRSLEYLRINAIRWGAISGNEAAEAFEIIRKIES